jgi:hypothetical protein
MSQALHRTNNLKVVFHKNRLYVHNSELGHAYPVLKSQLFIYQGYRDKKLWYRDCNGNLQVAYQEDGIREMTSVPAGSTRYCPTYVGGPMLVQYNHNL